MLTSLTSATCNMYLPQAPPITRWVLFSSGGFGLLRYSDGSHCQPDTPPVQRSICPLSICCEIIQNAWTKNNLEVTKQRVSQPVGFRFFNRPFWSEHKRRFGFSPGGPVCSHCTLSWLCDLLATGRPIWCFLRAGWIGLSVFKQVTVMSMIFHIDLHIIGYQTDTRISSRNASRWNHSGCDQHNCQDFYPKEDKGIPARLGRCIQYRSIRGPPNDSIWFTTVFFGQLWDMFFFFFYNLTN